MTPGFHIISAEQYHADPTPGPSLSNSVAKVLLTKSPMHAYWCHPKLGNGREEESEEDESGRLNYGSACHDVLLEGGGKLAVLNPEDYPSQPKKKGEPGSIPKGWTNGAIRAARDEQLAAGKLPVLPRQGNRIQKMVEAARKFIESSEIAEYWTDARSEVTGIWQEQGIWLRCRFDRLHNGYKFIGDYKSTGDASPDSFSRLIARMGYHIQDAFYRRCVRALGHPDPVYTMLAQEITAPFACSLHACDPALKEIADAQVELAIRTWGACLKAGKWPGYGSRIHWAVPTNYQMQEHEDNLAMEEA